MLFAAVQIEQYKALVGTELLYYTLPKINWISAENKNRACHRWSAEWNVLYVHTGMRTSISGPLKPNRSCCCCCSDFVRRFRLFFIINRIDWDIEPCIIGWSDLALFCNFRKDTRFCWSGNDFILKKLQGT